MPSEVRILSPPLLAAWIRGNRMVAARCARNGVACVPRCVPGDKAPASDPHERSVVLTRHRERCHDRSPLYGSSMRIRPSHVALVLTGVILGLGGFLLALHGSRLQTRNDHGDSDEEEDDSG